MSYPQIDNENFYKKITNKYSNYTIPKKKKTFKQICYPKEYKLQIPQIFLSKYINPKTPYKGVLIFHRIGAGKTCTAVNIGEAWKNNRRIIVVVPASLIGNFKNELRSPCAGNAYLTDKERNMLKKLHPSTKEYNEIIQKSDNIIKKYYDIYSYNKFIELSEEGEISFKNKILIIDEIQNMVSEKGKYYDVLYNTIHSAPKDLRIVLLSATPMFDRPIEIALTMNLLKLPKLLPIGKDFENMFIEKIETKYKIKYDVKNMDIFKEYIKGYISYYKGAPEYTFPDANIKIVKCVMSDFQYRSYLTVKKDEENEIKKKQNEKIKAFKSGDIMELPNNFFIGTRIISNISFPNKGIGEEGFKSLKNINLADDKLQIYSTKFYNIMSKIKRANGPVFVYSNFKSYGGIKSFIKVVEAYGYRNYLEYGEGSKRYAVWSGDEKIQLREEIKSVFNQESNKNGSKIRILILSPAAKEGLSLLSVKQAHILEPYWNYSRLLQIIGRGVRYCSHKYLDEDKRKIKVYIYLATHPNEKESVDEKIMKLAISKQKLIDKFEMAMKEAAIDCELFKNANGDINCEK